jgi:hypothetical protein
MFDCPMCTVAHADWCIVVDLESYYAAVGMRPAGPIWQCQRCLSRIPLARLQPQEAAETDATVQEYAQMEMF